MSEENSKVKLDDIISHLQQTVNCGGQTILLQKVKRPSGVKKVIEPPTIFPGNTVVIQEKSSDVLEPSLENNKGKVAKTKIEQSTNSTSSQRSPEELLKEKEDEIVQNLLHKVKMRKMEGDASSAKNCSINPRNAGKINNHPKKSALVNIKNKKKPTVLIEFSSISFEDYRKKIKNEGPPVSESSPIKQDLEKILVNKTETWTRKRAESSASEGTVGGFGVDNSANHSKIDDQAFEKAKKPPTKTTYRAVKTTSSTGSRPTLFELTEWNSRKPDLNT